MSAMTLKLLQKSLNSHISPTPIIRSFSVSIGACNKVLSSSKPSAVATTDTDNYQVPEESGPKAVTVPRYEPKIPIIKEAIANLIWKFTPDPTKDRAMMLDAAFLTYEELIDSLPILDFFIEFDMPDTFSSWFTVAELHTWLISARIMRESKYGYEIRDMITEAFFSDVVARSTRLGPRAALFRKKQIFILSCQFRAAYYGYDEGIQSDDKVLAAMVWRRFYALEYADVRKIERLVKYIRIQMDHLAHLTFNQIIFKRENLVIPLSTIRVPE